MATVNRIHIFGAAGSGSTTLANALVPYGFSHIEVDEAMFEPSDPPFLKRRTEKETLDYLLKQLHQTQKAVISGAMVGFGDGIKSTIDLFVFLHIPVQVRIERIKERERKRFGSRVEMGGDMYQMHMDFLAWVKAYESGDETVRSLAQHKKWLQDVSKPIIEITEVQPLDEIVERILPYLR